MVTGEPSRRQFLAGAAACVQGLGALPGVFRTLDSPVIEVHDPGWQADRLVHPRTVRAMLERGLRELTGGGSAAEAWRRIVSPGERVGIKFSKVSRNASGANQALGDALIDGLAQAGVRREDIIVVEAWGARFRGTGEFDGSYGPEVDTGMGRVRLSRFIREQIDALISVPDLKHHPRLGVSGARSNLALATTVIDAPWRFHGPHLADHVTAIYALPPIAGKCRLHILNALRGVGDCRETLLLSGDAAVLDRVGAARAQARG